MLLCALLLVPALAAHAQYKWSNADGQVNYGDQPPHDARNVERLGVNAGSDVVDPAALLPFEIRRAARDFPVILYARGECGFCDDARAFLKARSVPFVERSVSTAEDVEAFRRLGGGDQLPAMALGRQMLRGYNAGTWSDALTSAGYPQGVPLPHGWQWPAPAPLAGPAPAPAPVPESGYAPGYAPGHAPGVTAGNAPNR